MNYSYIALVRSSNDQIDKYTSTNISDYFLKYSQERNSYSNKVSMVLYQLNNRQTIKKSCLYRYLH